MARDLNKTELILLYKGYKMKTSVLNIRNLKKIFEKQNPTLLNYLFTLHKNINHH